MWFLRRTYLHLASALAAFVLLEWLLLDSTIRYQLTDAASGGRWFAVLVLFMAVGWVADQWARSDTSPSVQYIGAALFVVAEVLLVCPLILRFDLGPTAALVAAIIVVGFVALHTASVLQQFRSHQHVAASLALLSAIPLLPWYLGRLVVERRR